MPELLREIFYPTSEEVETLHGIIIEQRGTRGWMSKGMVKGCLEWASTYVFNMRPFPTLLSQASALMYGFISFHPFADGNKRTALMTTAFFLFLNGHSLEIKEDAPDFTKRVAERCLDSAHDTDEEIARIAGWILKNTTSGGVTRQLYKIKLKNPLFGELLMLFAVQFWNAGVREVFRRFAH
jgi:death-on-curing protein